MLTLSPFGILRPKCHREESAADRHWDRYEIRTEVPLALLSHSTIVYLALQQDQDVGFRAIILHRSEDLGFELVDHAYLDAIRI